MKRNAVKTATDRRQRSAGALCCALAAVLLLVAHQAPATTNAADYPDNPERGKQGETMPRVSGYPAVGHR